MKIFHFRCFRLSLFVDAGFFSRGVSSLSFPLSKENTQTTTHTGNIAKPEHIHALCPRAEKAKPGFYRPIIESTRRNGVKRVSSTKGHLCV